MLLLFLTKSGIIYFNDLSCFEMATSANKQRIYEYSFIYSLFDGDFLDFLSEVVHDAHF